MILYEDHDIIVCYKPAGLPVQSARVGQMDMESMLNNHLAETWEAKWNTKDKTKGKNNTRTGGLKANVQKAPTVYVVHRLDQPVEGVLVFAKTKQAAASLSRQITDGSMRKIYQAVCCVTEEGRRTLHEAGAKVLKEHDYRPVNSEGENAKSNAKTGYKYEPVKAENEQKEYHLVDYLLKDGRTNTSSVVPEHTKNAKRAELSFRVLKLWQSDRSDDCLNNYSEKNTEKDFEKNAEKNSDAENFEPENVTEKENPAPANKYLLVEIELKTGRHHQIRVQMAHAGLPLYGDQKYFTLEEQCAQMSGHNARQKKERALKNVSSVNTLTTPALCAVSLTFTHPSSGKQMTFKTRPQQKYSWPS